MPGENPAEKFTFKIKINGHRIEPSDHIKYLGIYLDSILSGKYHCEVLSKKLRRANGMLSKVRHYVPKEELKSIYHSIFSSHMIYGCQIWGQVSQNVQNIQKLQDRAMRTIDFKDKFTNPDPIYVSNNILKLTDLVKLYNCLLTHQYLNNELPDCFNNHYFQLHSLYYTQTRNSDLGCLFQPSRRTTRYGLNSISNKSIVTWNAISKNMKLNLSSLSFYELKKKLTDIFLEFYIMNNHHNDNNNVNNNVNYRNNRIINNVNNHNHNRNINNNINFQGIQVLRRGGNDYGRLANNWNGQGLVSRWDN